MGRPRTPSSSSLVFLLEPPPPPSTNVAAVFLPISLYPPPLAASISDAGELPPNPKIPTSPPPNTKYTGLLRHLRRWPRRRWLRGAAAEPPARPPWSSPDASVVSFFLPITLICSKWALPTPTRGVCGVFPAPPRVEYRIRPLGALPQIYHSNRFGHQ
jgi:hypothetical protein